MKKKLVYSILLGSLFIVSSCSSNDSEKSTSKVSESSTTVEKSSSKSTVKEVLKEADETLQEQLKATPTKDTDQELKPNVIPNFVGMTMDEARTVKDNMEDANFVMSMSDQVYRSDIPEGTILAQSAKAGTEGGGKWMTFIASTQNESSATPMEEASFN